MCEPIFITNIREYAYCTYTKMKREKTCAPVNALNITLIYVYYLNFITLYIIFYTCDYIFYSLTV